MLKILLLMSLSGSFKSHRKQKPTPRRKHIYSDCFAACHIRAYTLIQFLHHAIVSESKLYLFIGAFPRLYNNQIAIKVFFEEALNNPFIEKNIAVNLQNGAF